MGIKQQAISRCKICNLPHDFAGITFNENGECNYCTSQKEEFNYPGLDALKRDINNVLSNYPNRSYDCAVAFSGGRDSSYLLYFAKVILGLKVLAVSIEHDFITPEAKNNIQLFVKKLDVDLHIIPNNILNKAGKQCVRNWSKKPDTAMLLTFCTGCRYGIRKMIPDYVKKLSIPLLLFGNVPYEAMKYRVNLLCDGKAPTTKNKIIGFTKRLLKNPSYLKSPKTLYYQFMDFKSWDYEKKGNSFPQIINPFYYIEYEEEEINAKIKELGWEQNNNFPSIWRSDCYMNMLRQFFYKKLLGYNDMDEYFSILLRKKKISFQDAIKGIQNNGTYDEQSVRTVLKDFFDVNYDDICKKLPKNKKVI